MADTNELSYPLFNSVKTYMRGLAADEVIGFFILGAIATTLFWFVMTNVFGKKVEIGSGKKWCIWVTMTFLFAIPLLLAFDLARYVGAKANQATVQLEAIRNAVTNASSKPAALNEPNFQCEITDNVCIMGAQSGDHIALVVVCMYVLNNGPQSIAWKWKCSAKLTGGTTLNSSASQYPVILEPVSLPPGAIYGRTDKYLPSNLLENPLNTGAGKDGWVAFKFPVEILDELYRPGVEFTVSFEDKNNRKTTVQWVVPVGYGKSLPKKDK